ncbi:MAG: BamA/TamA family outer membrane protein, partial [Firmicutes bacterium]|nr:BamA/TamA family outer membrane protein [Bacillota bacterium]
MQKNNRSNNINMIDGPLFGNIIRYAVPLMLTGILQLLFNAADLVVVGRYCGRLSIAAVGATGAIINLIVNLFIGLSVGVGVNWTSPFGPLRIDLAKALLKAPGDDSKLITFNVGGQ